MQFTLKWVQKKVYKDGKENTREGVFIHTNDKAHGATVSNSESV